MVGDGGQPAQNECGASAAEYALLISLVAIVILAAVTAFGMEVSDLFQAGCAEVAKVHGDPCS